MKHLLHLLLGCLAPLLLLGIVVVLFVPDVRGTRLFVQQIVEDVVDLETALTELRAQELRRFLEIPVAHTCAETHAEIFRMCRTHGEVCGRMIVFADAFSIPKHPISGDAHASGYRVFRHDEEQFTVCADLISSAPP